MTILRVVGSALMMVAASACSSGSSNANPGLDAGDASPDNEGGGSYDSNYVPPSDEPCGSPYTTYACSPEPADAGGCAPDPDSGIAATYPVGCTATLAGCTSGSSVVPRPLYCQCVNSDYDGGLPQWSCPD